MALRQTLQQKQLQKLSPQQIQLMKLLQIPTAILDERIKEEIEENPALEMDDEQHSDDNQQEEYAEEPKEQEEYENDGSESDYENIDINEYVQDGDDDIADYKLRDENYGQEEEYRIRPSKVETSFIDLMNQQLGMLKISDHERKIAEQIIGTLDDDGYLRREIDALVDDLAFRQNILTDEEETLRVLQMVQQLDPPGVAARDLQECLLLQINRMPQDVRTIQLATKILEKYFDEFTKKHYEKIQKALNIDNEELKIIINHIIRLNPKPGGATSELNKNSNYIIPDFFIHNINGKLELSVNSKNAPDLRISEGYRDMLKDYDRGSKKDKRQKEAVLFIKQKIDSAKWFIDAIKQRQNTLLLTMQAILDYQKDFFASGDETDLKPMILKDISEITGLDISTISRVANSKFVQTEFGTYRLKFFFSESLQTESGEEVSTREVKKILSDIIEEESKKHPYSDEKLTELLQEKGYNIARRTVAKYREQLNIPVARLRKSL